MWTPKTPPEITEGGTVVGDGLRELPARGAHGSEADKSSLSASCWVSEVR
jgi:hypothetical protein